jgi:hypothetical protein
MRLPERKEPGPRASEEAGPVGMPSWAAGNPEYSANPLIIQRLQRRFRLSPELAAAVVQLAGLSPREARP